MDFPLSTSRSEYRFYAGHNLLSGPPAPAHRNPDPSTAAQSLQIKNYHPLGRTIFIDVEYQETPMKIERSPHWLWPDFQMQKAFRNYHRMADPAPPSEKRTVDRFI